VGPKLVDWLGVRGEAAAAIFARELDLTEKLLLQHVRSVHEARIAELDRSRADHRSQNAPFAELTRGEMTQARLTIRRFAERLRGGARVRTHRAKRGPVDVSRTLRAALRTGGVPLRIVHRDIRRRRPKLVLLCDISESVRTVAAFLLEFTYAAQELFDHTEMTAVFDAERPAAAIGRAWSAAGVHAGDNSNYGRAFRTFVARHLKDVDRATTVVILGDGRNNYHDPAVEQLEAIRRRARALLWLCPEPRGAWARGDSAMALYSAHCTATYEVGSVGQLERAARSLVAPRLAPGTTRT
jgi:uncharacterized protein with von Willebrand factor type A (vWA) domain